VDRASGLRLRLEVGCVADVSEILVLRILKTSLNFHPTCLFIHDRREEMLVA